MTDYSEPQPPNRRNKVVCVFKFHRRNVESAAKPAPNKRFNEQNNGCTRLCSVNICTFHSRHLQNNNMNANDESTANILYFHLKLNAVIASLALAKF